MKGLAVSAKKVFIIIARILLLYSLLGFLALPALIKNQAPKLAQEHLNRAMKIEAIQFNPFSMELKLDGFEVKNLKKGVFASFDHFYVNVAVLQSIYNLTLIMDTASIERPYVLVKRDKKGNFNFSDLLTDEQSETEEADTGVLPVTISKLAISEGKVSWEDNFYSKPQKENIYPLNLNIDNFTTRVSEQSQLNFTLMLASGGKLKWQGGLELNPLSSKGNIKLDKVDFHRIWELFLQDAVNFKIHQGSELIEMDYDLTDTEKGIQVLVKNAHIDINDFQLSEKGSDDALINVPDFKVSGINYNLLKNKIEINEVSVKNVSFKGWLNADGSRNHQLSEHAGDDALINIPDFKMSGINLDLLKNNIEITEVSAIDASFKSWLNADGNINYQSLLGSETEAESEPQQNQNTAEDKQQPWRFTVKQLALQNFALHFIDKTLAKPVPLNLTSINFNVTNVTDSLSLEIPYDLDLKFNDSGVLNVKGSTVPEPFSTTLQVDVGNIAIKDFQPYIDQFVRLDVISGLFNVKADVSLLQNENKPMEIRFKGDSIISDFVTRDQKLKKDFLKWKQLNINNMDMDLSTNSYNIDTVKFDQLYARVLIRKDKTMNVDDITIDTPETKSPPVENKATNTQAEVKPTFKIKKFELVKSETDFSDLSLILPFSANIKKLKGSVTGISSDKNALIKVALKGRAHDLAPVIIKGDINPDKGDSEIELDFKSLSLPLMTPYMAEFAGRKIEKGNMSLNLKYKVKTNKLTASNTLLIDQLVLGDKVENPEAVSLPLDLAIILLEDSDGKINLDVPITGSLDDPQFSVGSIIIDALVNVLTKIVSSPFNAIASLIEGDGDPSKVLFDPGKVELTEQEQQKLDGLANALKQKEALKLEIKGAAFSEYDWPQLQEEALKKQLTQIKADEISQDEGKKVLAEHVTLTEDDYEDLLADLFIQKFPELADRSIFGTPRLIETETETETGDFYQVAKTKMAALIPPDKERLQELAAARAKAIAQHLIEKEISIERVYLLDVEIDPEVTDDVFATTMNLTVN